MKNEANMKRLLGSVLCLIFVAGCGSKQESAEIQTSGPSEVKVSASKTVDPATTGTIKGKVLFEGQAPEPKQISVKGNPECAVLHAGGTIASEELVVKDGNMQNVFVCVKQGLEGYSFTAPSTPVVIENKTCMYVPHVSGAMVGQSVEFLNQDSTLHNIHAYPKNGKAFNLGLPLVGMKQTRKIDAAEVMVPLKCDVHPWMQGYLGVLPHPYFSVSGANGTFELKNLPPGDYVIEAWQEKLGVQSQNVTIGPQETKEIEFKFSA